MLYITGWIENELSHPFSTTTDNWTWTWFGAHICRYDTRLLIFCNKKTILQYSNINVFKSRITYFSFNKINTTCVAFPI